MPRCHLGLADKMTGHAGGNNYIIAFAHVLGRQTLPLRRTQQKRQPLKDCLNLSDKYIYQFFSAIGVTET